MTRRISEFLDSIIGDVTEIDEGVSSDCDGKFLRVHVVIDIDKPLQRCLRADVIGDGVKYVMLLRYERLPDHCFSCGRFSHKIRECTNLEGE
ncbi:hypothetical protein Dsin_027759 [Dipteronia sinensis]|uniref:CCHC-type domain-containing protein n=1 Tax=Dipteronia sinensis TaxID=43782 RepID=A0AAE0DTL0_9ROSI|nr:hypothetical protein Dsin_027759 [Dipteronia sinensis]